jgi:hypothetical protein
LFGTRFFYGVSGDNPSNLLQSPKTSIPNPLGKGSVLDIWENTQGFGRKWGIELAQYTKIKHALKKRSVGRPSGKKKPNGLDPKDNTCPLSLLILVVASMKQKTFYNYLERKNCAILAKPIPT